MRKYSKGKKREGGSQTRCVSGIAPRLDTVLGRHPKEANAPEKMKISRRPHLAAGDHLEVVPVDVEPPMVPLVDELVGEGILHVVLAEELVLTQDDSEVWGEPSAPVGSARKAVYRDGRVGLNGRVVRRGRNEG